MLTATSKTVKRSHSAEMVEIRPSECSHVFSLYREPIGRVKPRNANLGVGSVRPMEDAAMIVYSGPVLWLRAEFSYNRWNAYQLLTQAGRPHVGHMVDTLCSLVAAIDRKYLRPTDGRMEG